MSTSHGQAGGIITGWLLRLMLWLAVLAVVVFEIGAVVVASVDADSAAGEVARAAVVAYRSSGSLADAETAAETVAEGRSVELISLEENGTTMEVEVGRDAGTLLLHRLALTEDLTQRTASRHVQIRS